MFPPFPNLPWVYGPPTKWWKEIHPLITKLPSDLFIYLFTYLVFIHLFTFTIFWVSPYTSQAAVKVFASKQDWGHLINDSYGNLGSGLDGK